MNKNIKPYYKLLTEQGATEATIFLYGYIGEEWSWDPGLYEYVQTGVTDIDFVKELNALSAQYPVIHLRINSPGGDFFHGNAIMSAIQNSAAEIHTWNDGICASMAADIWMCGKQRHMAKNALLMIHPAWNMCAGNAMTMRECADALDKFTESAITATAASIGITADEMRSRYYADYKDHWLTYSEAVTDGLVSDTTEYAAADPMKVSAGMPYKKLLETMISSEATAKKEADTSIIGRIREVLSDMLGTQKQTIITQQQKEIMELEDFKKSLADGSLDPVAVKAELDALEAAKVPKTDSESEAIKALRDEFTAVKTELENTRKALNELGAKPGAERSTPDAPETDLPTAGIGTQDAKKALDEANANLAKIAASGQNPYMQRVI